MQEGRGAGRGPARDAWGLPGDQEGEPERGPVRGQGGFEESVMLYKVFPCNVFLVKTGYYLMLCFCFYPIHTDFTQFTVIK
jgi:hypothetical protein